MTTIKTVHVIFKTHLDIGFTDLAKNVVDKYMNQFIPQAIELSEKASGEEEKMKFVWTTGSWLIHEFLETAPPEQRLRMEEAIRQGFIAWHGLPFTTHTELMDEALFEFGLSLSKKMDRRFGKTTIAAKMTDVPGHTISMVPILARNGIKYLHLGVNPVCSVPQVPSVFVWRASDGSEIIVNYAQDYGQLLEIDGLEDALYFAHTGDNKGPISIEELRTLYDQLQGQYPGAQIMASTLDAFAEKLLPFRHVLPVVCEEIGDTWIHGVGTDPLKVARYRELLRLRDQWIASGEWAPQSESYSQFCNCLMLIAEHTWGFNEQVYLGDYRHYSAAEFAAARAKNEVDGTIMDKYFYLYWPAKEKRTYRFFESSWKEQRDYIDQALSALPEGLKKEALLAFERLSPSDQTNPSASAVALGLSDIISLGQFQVGFASDGSINRLVDRNGKRWADEANRLGVYRYETFGQENYDRFFREYMRNMKQHHGWADADFAKPGMAYAEPKPVHQRYAPTASTIRLDRQQDCDLVTAELKLPASICEQFGAPERLYLVYKFYAQEPNIDIELHWLDKNACRLPEASWLSFGANVDNPNLWSMDKLGGKVSPLSVVKGGNRNMHAVNGIHYAGADGSAAIETLDAPVCCPGKMRLLQFDNTFAPLDGGFHFNLHNNVWGTNFPMWFEDDMKFRFRLTLVSNAK